MSEQPTRRKFLQLLGFSASATLMNTNGLARNIPHSQIRKLNSQQKQFMIGYEKWMDEFIEVIRIQKTDPDNLENHRKMIVLTEKAEELKPELNEFMKDETFSVIFRVSIERMSKEI